jgi:hypothetical protein
MVKSLKIPKGVIRIRKSKNRPRGLFFDLRILITLVASSNFWPLHGLFFDLRILITPVVSSNMKNRPHNGQRFEDTTRVIRIRKSKNRPHNGQMFEDTTRVLPLHGLFFDLRILITPVVSSNIWPLHGLFFDLRILITPVVSSNF